MHTTKEFTRELHVKVQVIRHSVVGGHHHNGVADNAINDLVIIARTMMIHSELSWPDSSEIILCPMDMAHSVHLHNHTPNIYSGMSPEEDWTISKSSNSALQNYHPWGCSEYVL